MGKKRHNQEARAVANVEIDNSTTKQVNILSFNIILFCSKQNDSNLLRDTRQLAIIFIHIYKI